MGFWSRLAGGEQRKTPRIELPPQDERGRFIPRSVAAEREKKRSGEDLSDTTE